MRISLIRLPGWMSCLAVLFVLPPQLTRGAEMGALYVSKYCELRDNDAPTKYVFNGDTRVAHVTGSLSANARVQRLRVYAGWNLCSLAVVATNAFVQLSSVNGQTVVTAAYKWVPPSSNFTAIAIGETLPAGTVVWLNSTTNAILSVRGSYSEPVNVNLPAGNSFVPSAGLEAWNISNGIPPNVIASAPQAQTNHWQWQFNGFLRSQSDFPEFASPGKAIFISAASPTQLAVPDAVSKVSYYHDDHLQSTCCTSDALGRVTDQYVYYPFGSERLMTGDRSGLPVDYTFQEKERDLETGLLEVGLRYSVTELARMTKPDPLLEELDFVHNNLAGAQKDPQRLNIYAFVRNNPVRYVDPTGLAEQEPQKAANETYLLLVVINESSLGKKGAVDVGENPGHTAVFLYNGAKNQYDTVSYGPREHLEFSTEGPGTAQHPLKATDEYHVFEFFLTKDQYEHALAFVKETQQNPGLYNLNHQCTTVAQEVAAKAGIKLPEGRGELKIPLVPARVTTSTPVHLMRELLDTKTGIYGGKTTAAQFQNIMKVVP